MKLEEIITLLNAGYTKEEIQALDQPAASSESHAADVSQHLSAAADTTASTSTESDAKGPEHQQDAPAPDASEKEDKVLGAISALTAAIQKMNVQNSNIAGGDTETTPEDILANIINPPRGGKRK